MIVVLAIVGLLPLLVESKALDATTVSGLVVMGLAPPIVLLLFTSGYRPLTFHLPFWWCARRPGKLLWFSRSRIIVSLWPGYRLASAPCCKATPAMASLIRAQSSKL